MIWSIQELARLAICKDDVIAEKVFSHLDEPDNQDIWKAENFSLLWGLLGTAGVKEITADSAEKIWEMLSNNKVLDAYDKGILDDFNRRLMQQYNDERMRGWINLDNYTVGLKFRKMILLPLTKLSDKIKNDVDIKYPNPDKLIEKFAALGDMTRLKTYLESIKPITNDEAAFGIDEIFDKEQSLKKLSKAITYTVRHLGESQKDYLWYYFIDAVNKGFDYQKIEITDKMLARLVADASAKSDSELNIALLQNRNDSICEFVQSVENADDFYEETAAKMVSFNPDGVGMAVTTCLDFAKVSDNPKGVVLALALVNLKQIKSAVTILMALAEKGVATEACAYMHRLLPLAKGGESVISDLLKDNLLKLKERSVLAKNEAYQAYVSRYYLLAVKAFIDVGCFETGADLLNFIVKEAWFEPQTALADDFKTVANQLLFCDKNVVSLFQEAIDKFGFSVFYEQDIAFIGEGADNPLTQARHRMEQSIKEATTFDVSGVFDKMATVETGAYNALQNLKKNLKKTEDKKEENIAEEKETIVVSEATPEPTGTAEQMSVNEVTENEQVKTEEVQVKMEDASLPMSPLDEITRWEEPEEAPLEHDESIVGGLKRFKNIISDKVNWDIDSILKVSALDIDKHFEKIKQVADNALNMAKEQMNDVKDKVEKIDVSKVPSMDKVKDFAKRFQFKRKKDE